MPPIILSLLLVAAIGFVAYLISDFLTRQSIEFARKRNLVAQPNERSSHTIPTPRVGGIGIVAGLMVGFLVLAVMLLAPDQMPYVIRMSSGTLAGLQLGAFFLSVILAFVIGYWDDRHDTPAVFKLLGQVAIAIIPPVAGLQLTHLQLPYLGMIEFNSVVSILVTAVWILVVMNSVNFMDGINGLAGRFAQIVGFAALVAAAGAKGSEAIIPLSAALIGATWGFLGHNFPRAKTFMGDCGSQPLGVFIALLGIVIANAPLTYPLPFVGYLIVVSVFLFDVLYTLIRRSLRGQNVFIAHREHLYQRYLIATGENHHATFHFVEFYIYVTAILGAIYLRFFFGNQYDLGQVVFIASTIAALAHYAWRVHREERHPGENAPAPSPDEQEA